MQKGFAVYGHHGAARYSRAGASDVRRRENQRLLLGSPVFRRGVQLCACRRKAGAAVLSGFGGNGGKHCDNGAGHVKRRGGKPRLLPYAYPQARWNGPLARAPAHCVFAVPYTFSFPYRHENMNRCFQARLFFAVRRGGTGQGACEATGGRLNRKNCIQA